MNDHITLGQEKAARFILKDGLDQDFSIHIWDGYEWCYAGVDLEAAIAALASTGEDTVEFRKEGKRVGMVHFVWGNAPDGTDLWSDSSDNATLEAMFERFAAAFPS